MTKKVIIIDDSVTSLNLLKGRFTNADWDAYGTSSAKEGYSMIFDIAPDLVVTDAIMPFIGGFQFVKMVRDNPKISKIPIIIYSVLPENRAKYYIKEDCIEYFLSKNDNVNELVLLAERLIKKYPLSESYKFEILKSKFTSMPPKHGIKIPEKLEEDEKIDSVQLEKRFKEKYNFSFSDEKIFGDFFAILHPILKYELCVVFPHPSFQIEQSAFFDIRDILLSPKFQNKIMEKFHAKDPVLYKKYAPNLKMIANEDEFLSKIEFNFDYKDNPLADIIFYSTEKSKWDDTEQIEIVKNGVYDFFKAYYINKNAPPPRQKENFGGKYFSDKFNILNMQEPMNKDKNAFIGILSISNYTDVISLISKEDTDILNSKISEVIIKYLTDDEQVIKNDEDEYSLIIQVKDSKTALDRFNFIISALENIKFDDVSLEVLIGGSECNINGNYNVFEAQKNAYKALEKANTTEKTVIYDATE